LNPHPALGVFFLGRGERVSYSLGRLVMSVKSRTEARFRLVQIPDPHISKHALCKVLSFLTIRLDLKWPRGYTPRHLNFSPFSARLLDPAS